MTDVAFVEQRRQLPSPAPSPSFGSKNAILTVVFTRQKTDHVVNEHRAPSLSVNAVKAELKRRQVHFNVNEIQNVREMAAYAEGDDRLVYFYTMAVSKAREKAFQAAVRKLSSFDTLEESKYVQLQNGAYGIRQSILSAQTGIEGTAILDDIEYPTSDSVAPSLESNHPKHENTSDTKKSTVRVIKRQSLGGSIPLAWDDPIEPEDGGIRRFPGSRSPPYDVRDARELLVPAIPSFPASHADYDTPPSPPITNDDVVQLRQAIPREIPTQSALEYGQPSSSATMPGYLASIWQGNPAASRKPGVIGPPPTSGYSNKSPSTEQGPIGMMQSIWAPHPSPSLEQAPKGSTASRWAPGPADPPYVSPSDPSLPNDARTVRGSLSAWGPPTGMSVPFVSRTDKTPDAVSSQTTTGRPSLSWSGPSVSPPVSGKKSPELPHPSKRRFSALWDNEPSAEPKVTLGLESHGTPKIPPVSTSSSYTLTYASNRDTSPMDEPPTSSGHTLSLSVSSPTAPSPVPPQSNPSVAHIVPSPVGWPAQHMQSLVPDQVTANHHNLLTDRVLRNTAPSTNVPAAPPGLYAAVAHPPALQSSFPQQAPYTMPVKVPPKIVPVRAPPRLEAKPQPIPTFVSGLAESRGRNTNNQPHPPFIPQQTTHERTGSNVPLMPNAYAQPVSNSATYFSVSDAAASAISSTSTNPAPGKNNVLNTFSPLPEPPLPNSHDTPAASGMQNAFSSAPSGYPMPSAPLGLGLPSTLRNRPNMPGVPQFHNGVPDWMTVPQQAGVYPTGQIPNQFMPPDPAQWAQRMGHQQVPSLTMLPNGLGQASQPPYGMSNHPGVSSVPGNISNGIWMPNDPTMAGALFPQQDPRNWMTPPQYHAWQAQASMQAQAQAQARAAHAARVSSIASSGTASNPPVPSSLNASATPFEPPVSAAAPVSQVPDGTRAESTGRSPSTSSPSAHPSSVVSAEKSLAFDSDKASGLSIQGSSPVRETPVQESGASAVVPTYASAGSREEKGAKALTELSTSQSSLGLQRVRPLRLKVEEIDTLLLASRGFPPAATLYQVSPELEDLDRAASAFFERTQRSLNSVQIRLKVNLRGMMDAMYQPAAVVQKLTPGVIERFVCHILGILEIAPLEDITHTPLPLEVDVLKEEERSVLRQIVLRIDRRDYAAVYERLKTRLPSYLTILEAFEPTD